jgi:hypothetical protein
MSSLLFGDTLPSSTTGSLTTTNDALPDWYQAYTRGIAAKADAVSSQPYTAYSGDRIAGFDPAQTQAQDSILNNTGVWGNDLNTAEAGASSTAGLGALASSNLNRASNMDFTTGVQSYMSPYTSSVVDEIARQGNKNLFNNVIPGVNSTFTGAGQFGSTRNGAWLNNAISENNSNILGQQSTALQHGYDQAAQNFLTEQSQLGQLGQTAGTLSNQGATALGQLGQTRSTLGLSDANAEMLVGQQRQAQAQQGLDLAYNDFLQQRDYPQAQLSYLNSIIRGIPVDNSSFTTSSDLSTQNTGNTGSNSGLSSIIQGISGVAGIKKALGIT